MERHPFQSLKKRIERLELSQLVWKTRTLPLSYIRSFRKTKHKRIWTLNLRFWKPSLYHWVMRFWTKCASKKNVWKNIFLCFSGELSFSCSLVVSSFLLNNCIQNSFSKNSFFFGRILSTEIFSWKLEHKRTWTYNHLFVRQVLYHWAICPFNERFFLFPKKFFFNVFFSFFS